MLYLLAGQTNNIVVTFTERAKDTNALYYVLELRHIATNDVFTFAFLKSANLSGYTNRYDKFALILDADFPTGQYRYTAFESTTSVKSGSIGVVENGLAAVKFEAQDYEAWDNTISYVEKLPRQPKVWQITSGGQGVTTLPSGVFSGDTIEFIDTAPGTVVSFSGFPEYSKLRFRVASGGSVTICHNWLNSGIMLDDNYNVVIEDDIVITLRKIEGDIMQIDGSGTTYPTGIYITGVNGGHEATVLQTYLTQYPEAESRIVKGYLPYPDTNIPSASIFFAQIMQAGGYRCEQLTISYTAAISNIALRDYISNQIPSAVLPIGGNSNVEIMSPTTMLDNSFVFVSAGNGTQRLQSYGNALEFWDTETANSWVVPLIAAKLMQIADNREDGDNLFERHVGARWAARAAAIKNNTTHPNGQIWNKLNGYGRPSVSAATAYTGEVPTSIYVAIQDFTFSLIFN